MTISPDGVPSGLLGDQQPRFSHYPAYVSTSGHEAIELAAKAGLFLDPWQQFVLLHALGERADGRWAAPSVGLCVGRQNGKNAILEAVELAGLFLLNERVIIHSAHEQSTSSEHFRRLLGRMESVPEFDRRILKAPKGKGAEAIELRGGQRILFKTRTGSTVRGFSIDRIVYDEAMQLSAWAKAAMIPALAANSQEGNLQIWYTGSAVDQQNPKHDGVEFARIREHGLNRVPGVAWFEWSAEGDNPERVEPDRAADPAVWAQANPGMGIRISTEWIEHERSIEMGQREFAVERLGIGDWPSPDGANSALNLEKWALLVDRQSAPEQRIVCAFDVEPDRGHASIAIAGKRLDGDWHIEIIDRRAGTEWLAGRLLQVCEDHHLKHVFCDGVGASASLIPEFAERRLKVHKLTTHEHVQACGVMFDMVERMKIRHRGTPELDAAVRGAEKRPLGDAWAWNRRKSDIDISPLVACTLAIWGTAIFRSSRVAGF